MTAEQIKKEFQFILPAGLQDFEWEAIIKKVNKIRQEDLEEIERIGAEILLDIRISNDYNDGFKQGTYFFLSKIKELYK